MRKKLLFYLANIDYYFHKFFPKKVKKVRNYYSLDRSLFRLKFAILKIVSNILNLSLSELFYICGSDKYKNYNTIYDFLTTNFKKEDKINILEIGIGSHNLSGSGGASLIALSLYYKEATIYGIDLFDKSFLNIANIQTIIGDQSSKKNLKSICNKLPNLDIVIDDGSHFVNHQFNTFNIFYKTLKNNGLYIIEDIAGSYRVRNNGNPDLEIEKNIISYFQKYVHCVNYCYLKKQYREKFSMLKDINSISFFQDCVVIQRKDKNFKNVNEKDIYLTLDKFNKKYSKNKKKRGYIESR